MPWFFCWGYKYEVKATTPTPSKFYYPDNIGMSAWDVHENLDISIYEMQWNLVYSNSPCHNCSSTRRDTTRQSSWLRLHFHHKFPSCNCTLHKIHTNLRAGGNLSQQIGARTPLRRRLRLIRLAVWNCSSRSCPLSSRSTQYLGKWNFRSLGRGWGRRWPGWKCLPEMYTRI